MLYSTAGFFVGRFSMEFNIRTKFIAAVGKSGLRFEELACIGGFAEISLYKFAAGKMEFSDLEKERLAEILGSDAQQLFIEEDK